MSLDPAALRRLADAVTLGLDTFNQLDHAAQDRILAEVKASENARRWPIFHVAVETAAAAELAFQNRLAQERHLARLLELAAEQGAVLRIIH